MNRLLFLVTVVALSGLVTIEASYAEIVTFRVGSWNMESGESSDAHLKQQIGEKEKVDLWGFSEVENQAAAKAYEEGAEIGENADYEMILGTTGGADRLAIVFNTARLTLIDSEELQDSSFASHRKPLVARFRGLTTGIEFKFMVNHLARGNAQARLDQAEFLNRWVTSESLPVIAVGDYNFDWHVQFGDSGERDPGFDAMTASDNWIWLRPATLVKTQASDGFMSVLDFVFFAHPPQGVTGEATIIDRAGDTAAVDLDFDDSPEDTDHRPVTAFFTVGRDSPPIEDPEDGEPGAPGIDREAIMARIAALEREWGRKYRLRVTGNEPVTSRSIR